MTAPSRVRPAEAGHSAFTRRTLVKGAAWATPVAAFSLSAPAMAASPLNCMPAGTLFDAQSRARILSGMIGGADLDALAEVGGAHAVASDPPTGGGTATQALDAGQLDVGLLSAIQLNLGGLTGVVSELLDLTTGQEAGILNEYAFAHAAFGGDGTAEVGGAGAVDRASGMVTFDEQAPNPPSLGTINLKSLLLELTESPGVTDFVSTLAGLDLDIGAVAGRASMDSGCEDPGEEDVTREYNLAYLKLLVVDSTATSGLLDFVNTSLGTITLSTDQIYEGLEAIPALGPLLSLLGSNTLSLTASLNPGEITGTPLPEGPSEVNPEALNPAVQLNLSGDPAQGSPVTIDLGALLGEAYGGGVSPWLNDLAPNSRLLIEGARAGRGRGSACRRYPQGAARASEGHPAGERPRWASRAHQWSIPPGDRRFAAQHSRGDCGRATHRASSRPDSESASWWDRLAG
ncbi:choice-of-anchor G family protein [Brachybacterium sp. Z12]|uniref:choice-of-anchor G family protein n=1 Tax=Brachybacterium sp. Z12 TaxID=2759167 RepID=UPI001861D14B|nr:choice-of-anchor G family protein [Brachybacterium sp. Z12]QNN82691.1 choice-of-anchor G family protein [Brachybacterium sp. Z12]